MKNNWLVFIMAIVLVAICPAIIAQEALFIKGGEIDGIRVGPFYLSSEVITNQDYFNFIQQDGYKNLALWDAEALKNFDKFKSEQGDFAPRTWKGGSPPVGQEYQPVLGITVYEARAYARYLGWTIPHQKMWRLAHKVREDIGEYPWKDEQRENINAIRMARYYAPANVWENRFQKLQSEMSNLKKSSAPLSRVNINASVINKLERELKTMQKQNAELVKVAQQVNAKVAAAIQEQMGPLSAKIKELQQKTIALAEEQKQLLAQQTKEFAKKLKAIAATEVQVKKQANTAIEQAQQKFAGQIDAIDKKLTANIEKMWNDKLKALQAKQKQWEARLGEITTLSEQLQKTAKDLGLVQEKQKEAAGQIAELKTNQENQNKEQREFTRQQIDTLQKSLGEIKDKLIRIDKLDHRLQDCHEQIQRLNTNCPSLPDGNYAQALNSLKDIQGKQSKALADANERNNGLDKAITALRNQNFNFTARLNVIANGLDEARSSLSTLKESNSRLNTEIQSLKQQDSVLAKEDVNIKGMISSSRNHLEKQEKDINQLFQQTAQMESKGKELEGLLQESKRVDIEQSKKSDNLELALGNLQEKIGQQEKKDHKLEEEIKSLKQADIEYSKKMLSTNAAIEATRKRAQEIEENLKLSEKKFKELLKEFKDETNMVRNQFHQDINDNLTKLSEKANTNHASFVAIKQQIESLKVGLDNSISVLNKRMKKVESDHLDTVKQIHLSATEMRRGMMEVGEKIRSLFQNEMMFGPIPTETAPVLKKQQTSKQQDKLLKEMREKQEQFVKEIEKTIAKTAKQFEQTQQQIAATHKSIASNQQAITATQQALAEAKKKIAQIKPPAAVVPHLDKHLADLCYKLGKIYYSYSSHLLARQCLKLASELKHPQASAFWQKHWSELNCPKDMVQIQAKQYLFTIPLEYQEPLDQLTIPVFLRQQLRKNGYAISRATRLKIAAKDRSWELHDSKNRADYRIERQKTGLAIYRCGTALVGNPKDPELSLRQVSLADFYMDRHEVTRGEFVRFIATGAYSREKYWSEAGKNWRSQMEKIRGKFYAPDGWSDPIPGEMQLPVSGINYYEAEAYARWCCGKRLPTPEEWEYAARGPEMRTFPWGSNPPQIGDHFKANYRQLTSINDGFYGVAPVGKFKWDRSPFGIMAMAGNVAEWCAGVYQTEGSKRKLQVVKGGSCRHLWFQMQTFAQLERDPENSFDYIGFRCVQDIPARK